jgi:hypothetical protein
MASGGVGDLVAVDDVAEPSLQGPDGFFGGVTLDELAVVGRLGRCCGTGGAG